MDLLFKLSISAMLLGLCLIVIGAMLDYFDITGIVVILGCRVATIGSVLFVIDSVIYLWEEF